MSEKFRRRAKKSSAMLQSQQERDACALILRQLRRMSPDARQHWLKYQLALCDQAQKKEFRQKYQLALYDKGEAVHQSMLERVRQSQS